MLLEPGSDLYKAQKKLVSDLHDKGIKEKLISVDIIDINLAGNGNTFGVHVTDKIGTKYSEKQDFQANEYRWVYTVKKDGEKVYISNIEKWEAK